MKILNNIETTKQEVEIIKKNNQTIALVPTMGYLHEGHKSLIKEAKKIGDIVVISIFVNPLQFGENEDLDKYPKDFERDKNIAFELGVDYIFYPEEEEMYNNFKTFVEVRDLSQKMCGKTRPIHFTGVATVVLKLFNIIKPDYAVFGMKDAQQVRIIEKMVYDLNIDVEIIRGEIIRESDGLAYSSRNKYLSQNERKDAIALKEGLNYGKSLIQNGEKDVEKIKKSIIDFILEKFSIKSIDYISIVNFETLEEEDFVYTEVLLAGAIYIGTTRLIDNLLIKI
ncbi:MAG: pantoate--beta-alanine ligase [Fusobacteria bacterium]|jgi:pantoate--beta-alanine ligase|nr:pantoate--beta-alanine ligase [Fusobacteriota bacterium]